LITKKLGMSSLFTSNGDRKAMTLLKVESNQVVSVKTMEKDGYLAVQMGAGTVKVKNVTKPMKGHFAANKVEPKAKLVEFRVSDREMLAVGDVVDLNHFLVGQIVDASGFSTGKGFAGVMKRWNFRGLEASHGVSVSHRSHGSTGQRQDPGKVFKGKKMAGHMGQENVTMQNLEVIYIDAELGVIGIKGAVPGHDGGYVIVRDAMKRPMHPAAPFPASLASKI
jgi:large subunit ribosomal protein L3